MSKSNVPDVNELVDDGNIGYYREGIKQMTIYIPDTLAFAVQSCARKYKRSAASEILWLIELALFVTGELDDHDDIYGVPLKLVEEFKEWIEKKNEAIDNHAPRRTNSRYKTLVEFWRLHEL